MMTGCEIERKWLIDPKKLPYDLSKAENILHISQAYISFSPTIRIRSINETEFILTVKSHRKRDSLVHEEREFQLTAEEYSHLKSKCEGTVITKTRFTFPLENGLLAEVDFFEGGLKGLVYMEIEFPDEASAMAYPDPVFAVKDVSKDGRFTNAALAREGRPE